MPFSGPVEDRLALRELHDAYGDAVFRFDAEAWGANWAEDAVWNLMGQDIVGRDAIVGLWKQAMGQFSQVSFFSQPATFDVSGDQARGRVYTSEVLTTTGGDTRRVVGVYEDQYVKSGGRWLFASRRYSVLKEH
jgi:ketosteroid isomerase-like protein